MKLLPIEVKLLREILDSKCWQYKVRIQDYHQVEALIKKLDVEYDKPQIKDQNLCHAGWMQKAVDEGVITQDELTEIGRLQEDWTHRSLTSAEIRLQAYGVKMTNNPGTYHPTDAMLNGAIEECTKLPKT